jgi:uncharacterized protein (TIGR00255 family)
MTGYGKAEEDLNNKIVQIEIKSLNSKQIDIYTKIPTLYREKDLEIRNIISSLLLRGKVEVSLTVEYKSAEQSTSINKEIFKAYYSQLIDIYKDLKQTDIKHAIPSILRLPEVISQKSEELEDTEWKKVQKAILDALRKLNENRKKEGTQLEKDLRLRTKNIISYISDIEKFEQKRIDAVRQKLMDALQTFLAPGDIDKNRFEQELVYYLEKLDITEEKVRLRSHLKYFEEILDENKPIGKKLGFISQELGREINTLGSKANDADMQRIVVMMKDELEKIKEQILNIL